jgi:hypothetical protein
MSGDPFADLQAMIDSISHLEDLPKLAAPAVADVVREIIQDTIHAGTTPYGKPWPLVQSGKRKGEKALRNAGTKLFVTYIGPKVYVRLSGIDARHNNGATKGKVQRLVIPDDRGLSRTMAAEIRGVLEQTFKKTIEAGSS